MRRSTTIRIAATVAILAFLAACHTSDPRGDVGRGPADGSAARVTITGSTFDPGTLRFTAGRTVIVEITNDDAQAHDFAIEGLDLNTGTIEPGMIATATFRVARGRMEFACTYHGGMTGTIVGS